MLTSPASPAPPAPRYRIVREIARGGMAVVYLAEQASLGREVALKQLLPAGGARAVDVERFLLESRVAGVLTHPSIVGVLDSFEHDGCPCIAMEYVERGSLREHQRGLTVPQIAGALESVLAGLAFAASHRIVHRDLKLENLLVSGDGRVKIADFGIARAFGAAGPRLTLAGTTLGTPLYMSPEQAMGQDAGPASDLYALGVIAYELLCGRPPFPDTGNALSLLHRHIHAAPPPLDEVDPGLAAWVMRLLAKAPHERPASAQAAWEALEPVIVARYGSFWRREARILGAGSAGEWRPLSEGAFPAPVRIDEAVRHALTVAIDEP